MYTKSKAQFQEELKSEKRFSLFSFYTQWAVYCIFFVFKLELNLFIIIPAILFSLFRLFAILQKNLSPRIYLWNHLSSLFLLFFFTAFFTSISKGDINSILNWQLYYIALSFTIIHESMRVHKYAYLFISFLGFTSYTVVVFSIEDFQSFPITYKLIIPYLFLTYCTSLGYYINQFKRKAIQYYADLLQDKISINRDMALAHNVQESLFPQITKLKGLKFEIFRKSHNQIGGDFYDFIQLREGNIGIFITDVAGHGYSSAMVAAMLKVMVSTLPYYLKLDPTGLLGYIDKKLTNEIKSHHATALYIFINFQTQTFLLGNAGHPYFIYAKKGEEFQEIETFGTLLGFGLHDPVAETKEFKYESGDRFFIYTDGLIENMNEKQELLESSGLLKILNQNRKIADLKMLKEKVISDISIFSGKSEFNDDAMFLAFEIE
ncbi:MAG: serine/threonine-protein phosphatase [Leptospiraceae bacterium]|nr:serine/threonine-protein phosphatase [Leptospiraceae bacterium]